MVDETESDDGLDAAIAAFEAATGGEGTPASPPVALPRRSGGESEPPVTATPPTGPKPAGGGAAEPTPPPAESKPSLFGDLHSRYAPKPVDPRDSEVAGLRDQVSQLDEATKRVVLDRAWERAAADKREAVGKAQAIVAASGKIVPEGHETLWLENQLKLDAELHDAWSHRWDGPEQAARSERAVQRALQNFEKSLAKLPTHEDLALSYDRDAVSAAVRGASMKPAPPPPPPNVSKMSNREFADHVEKAHGYRPQLDGV